MSSDAIEIWVPRVALQTIFKVGRELDSQDQISEGNIHSLWGQLYSGDGYAETGYEKFYCKWIKAL